MYDFHSHILPGIDDGSKDIFETEKMIETEYAQGVDHILFTPHFYAQHESAEHFFKKRDCAYEKVLQLKSEKDYFPEIKVAAEVYFFPGISKAEILEKLCMTDSNLILIEMPFTQWDKSVYKEIRDIIEKRKLRVMLAHVERFIIFQKDKGIWDEVFELPLIPQINTGSLLEWKSRRFDISFIKNGHPVLLGTDCHNTNTRPPNMAEGRKVLEKKVGKDFLNEIDERGWKVWNVEG